MNISPIATLHWSICWVLQRGNAPDKMAEVSEPRKPLGYGWQKSQHIFVSISTTVNPSTPHSGNDAIQQCERAAETHQAPALLTHLFGSRQGLANSTILPPRRPDKPSIHLRLVCSKQHKLPDLALHRLM